MGDRACRVGWATYRRKTLHLLKGLARAWGQQGAKKGFRAGSDRVRAARKNSPGIQQGGVHEVNREQEVDREGASVGEGVHGLSQGRGNGEKGMGGSERARAYPPLGPQPKGAPLSVPSVKVPDTLSQATPGQSPDIMGRAWMPTWLCGEQSFVAGPSPGGG